MAEPAHKFDQTQQPGNIDSAPPGGPDLKVLEGGGESSPPTGNLSSVPDSPESLGEREQAAGQQSSTSGTKNETDQLGQHENQLGSGYLGSKNKTSRIRFSRRKKYAAGGGIIGLIVTIISFFILQGPFQFIHIAQLLQRFHFANQQSTQDDRFTKDVRFVRFAANGKVENTRLGFLGNKFANKFEAKLNQSGFQSTYSPKFGLFDGYVVDPENEKFKGMSFEEVQKNVKEVYGVDVVKGESFSNPELRGKWVIDGRKLGFFKARSLNRALLTDAKYSKIPASVGARLMGKRAAVQWHPLKKIDSRIQRAVDNWWTRRISENNKGATPTNTTAQDGTDTSSTQDQKDKAAAAKDAAAQTAADGQSANGDPSKIGAFQESLGGKLTAGGAAAAGALCLAKSIGAHADDIKQTQVVLPLMRMGMEAITVGNQVMNGQDVSLQQLGKYSKLLNGTDPQKNGKDAKATSWASARSIQAEMGQPQTGTAADSTLKSISGGNPFDFLSQGALGVGLAGVCSDIGTGIQIAIGFLGGPVSFLGQTAIAALTLPYVESLLAHWLAGNPVDPNVVGADYGNYINYGARLASNDQAIAAGGRALSTPESTQLASANSIDSQKDFQNHNIAYRLLNPLDSRSYISSVIDQQSSNPTNAISNTALALVNIGHGLHSLMGVPQKLFTAHAKAATPASYDYGFPEYGFSADELDNPAVENPYQNASDVYDLLSGPNGQDYIDKAKACFGITVAKDADGNWGVTSEEGDSPDYKKIPDYCASTGTNWLKVRFFILDTETMESVACYEGDEQSCTNIGFAGGDTQPGPVTDPSAPLTTLSGQRLSANQSKWIKFIKDEVLRLLPGDNDTKATIAARATWWTLKEGVLDSDNPHAHSICGSGNTKIAVTATCPAGQAWQVGIAAIQPRNFTLAQARAQLNGRSEADVLANVAKLVGANEGSAEYNAIINPSSNELRLSLLVRDPAIGLALVAGNVKGECIDQLKDWCKVTYTPGKDFTSSRQLINQTITELERYFKSSGGNAGTTITDSPEIYTDSTSIACAPNTKDVGIHDGYTQGRLVKIRICAVSNINSTSEESNDGYGVTGANGKLVVNSRASGVIYAMVEAAKADGVTMYANSGFRTMAHQQSLCPCDGVSVAVPGTSNHQIGLAVDFGTSSHVFIRSGDQWSSWLRNNAAKFGYKENSGETWHWSPSGG